MVLRTQYFWFLFMLIPSFGESQSFEALYQEAVDNNIELKIFKTDYLSLLERADQQSQLPNPEVGLGLFRPNSFMHAGKRILALRGSQMLPWFGQLDQKKKIELTNAEVYLKEIPKSQLEIKYQLKMAYLQWYEQEAKATILEKYEGLLKSMEEIALVGVESGRGSLVASLKIQLQQKEVEQQVAMLENEKRKVLVSINQLLNRPSKTNVEISDNLSFQNLVMDKSTWLQSVRERHPIFAQMDIMQLLSKQKIRLNKLDNKPTLGVGFDYGWINRFENVNFENNGRDMFQLNLMASIPIYQKKYKAKEREENLRIQSIEMKKEDALLSIEKEMETILAEYENVRLRYDLYQQQTEITQQAIALVKANYSTENASFNELLLLEKELIQYELKQLRAIVESHELKAKLDFYRF